MKPDSLGIEVGLYDADGDKLIQVIRPGDVIAVSVPATPKLAIAAVVLDDSPFADRVESVRLTLNDRIRRRDSFAPYALFGDFRGDFFGLSRIPQGQNSLKLELYDRDGGRGELLDTVVIDFIVAPASTVPSSEVTVAAAGDAIELGSDGVFTLSLSAAVPTDTTIAYTLGGTAAAGTDYAALAGTVAIPAGQQSAAIEIAATDDREVEGREEVILTLDEIVAGDNNVTIGAANTATVAITDPPLRALAQERDFYIGSAVSTSAFNGAEDSLYRETLAQEFNILTAENAMKFHSLQPQQGVFNFTNADAIADFAAENGQRLRGHTLVWHNALPDWLTEGTWTREEAIDILRTHIQTVVGRYRGRVTSWDLINEGIGGQGDLRNSFWLRTIGPDYIKMAFEWAHEADPDALLIYNDYGIQELNDKSDAVYQLLQDLLADGVPVHGVGFQAHFTLAAPPDIPEVDSNFARFRDLGLAIEVTELDVRIRLPSSTSELERQAQIYRDFLEVFLENGGNTFVSWGFTDRRSWIPGHFPGWGEALPLDENYQPKPAYNSLLAELSEPLPAI